METEFLLQIKLFLEFKTAIKWIIWVVSPGVVHTKIWQYANWPLQNSSLNIVNRQRYRHFIIELRLLFWSILDEDKALQQHPHRSTMLYIGKHLVFNTSWNKLLLNWVTMYDPIISFKLENFWSQIKHNINIIVHGHVGTFVGGSTLRVHYIISLLFWA